MESEQMHFSVSACCVLQSSRATEDMTMTGKDILNYSDIFLGWKNRLVHVYLKKAFCQSLRALWLQFGKQNVLGLLSAFYKS